MDGFTAPSQTHSALPSLGIPTLLLLLLLLLLRLPTSGRHYSGCRAQPCKGKPYELQDSIEQPARSSAHAGRLPA